MSSALITLRSYCDQSLTLLFIHLQRTTGLLQHLARLNSMLSLRPVHAAHRQGSQTSQSLAPRPAFSSSVRIDRATRGVGLRSDRQLGRRHSVQIKAFLGEETFKKSAQRIKSYLHTPQLQVIHDFYKHPTAGSFDNLLAKDCVIKTGLHDAASIEGLRHMVLDVVLPSAPDFSWDHATTGELDSDGYVLVIVTPSGHHTGKPYGPHGLRPVPAKGRHFCLSEQAHKVKVKGGKISEIVMLPAHGAGPLALYAQLGGEVPQSLAKHDDW